MLNRMNWYLPSSLTNFEAFGDDIKMDHRHLIANLVVARSTTTAKRGSLPRGNVNPETTDRRESFSGHLSRGDVGTWAWTPRLTQNLQMRPFFHFTWEIS